MRGMIIGHGEQGQNHGGSLLWQDTNWPGTLDPSSFLCLPKILEFFPQLLGSWQALYSRNHQVLLAAYHKICDEFEITARYADHRLGSMATIPLDHLQISDDRLDKLQDHLFLQCKIEIPIYPIGPKTRVMRISAHLYNTHEDFLQLIRAIKKYI